MRMNEAALKGALMRTIRVRLHRWVAFRLEDKFRSGLPDMAITGNGLTSWWEVKLANPTMKTTAVQDETMRRLAVAGFAFFLVYEERHGMRFTRILHPATEWENYKEHRTPGGLWCVGFDHEWVVQQMERRHAW
jgi:hypothetical protein